MRFTGSALAGGSAVNDRPYAAQARQMCPETDEHHDRVWFCLTCRGLETRLTPVSEFLAGSPLCGVVKYQVGRLRVSDALSGVGQVIAEAMNGPECFKCQEPITDFREVRIVTVRIDDKPVNVWVHDAHAKPGIVGPLDEYRGQ